MNDELNEEWHQRKHRKKKITYSTKDTSVSAPYTLRIVRAKNGIRATHKICVIRYTSISRQVLHRLCEPLPGYGLQCGASKTVDWKSNTNMTWLQMEAYDSTHPKEEINLALKNQNHMKLIRSCPTNLWCLKYLYHRCSRHHKTLNPFP